MSPYFFSIVPAPSLRRHVLNVPTVRARKTWVTPPPILPASRLVETTFATLADKLDSGGGVQASLQGRHYQHLVSFLSRTCRLWRSFCNAAGRGGAVPALPYSLSRVCLRGKVTRWRTFPSKETEGRGGVEGKENQERERCVQVISMLSTLSGLVNGTALPVNVSQLPMQLVKNKLSTSTTRHTLCCISFGSGARNIRTGKQQQTHKPRFPGSHSQP